MTSRFTGPDDAFDDSTGNLPDDLTGDPTKNSYTLGETVAALPAYDSAEFTRSWSLGRDWFTWPEMSGLIDRPLVEHGRHWRLRKDTFFTLRIFLERLYGVVSFSCSQPNPSVWQEGHRELTCHAHIHLLGKSVTVLEVLEDIENWPDETGIVTRVPESDGIHGTYQLLYRRGDSIFILEEEKVPGFGKPLIRNVEDIEGTELFKLTERSSSLGLNIALRLFLYKPRSWGRLYRLSWEDLRQEKDKLQEELKKDNLCLVIAIEDEFEFPLLYRKTKTRIAKYPRALNSAQDWDTARAEFRCFARRVLRLSGTPNKQAKLLDELFTMLYRYLRRADSGDPFLDESLFKLKREAKIRALLSQNDSIQIKKEVDWTRADWGIYVVDADACTVKTFADD